MSTPVLSASCLSYAFDLSPLFQGVGFSLMAGELLQICGDNGRGKTTLLRILAGLLEPTTGVITQSISAAHRLYLPHQIPLKEYLTVEENILMFCALKGRHEIDVGNAIHAVELSKKKKCLARFLSAGQKRRLGLAMVLAMPSQLLILDEPFTALDQKGRDLTAQVIDRYLKKGGAVIFTSHHTVNVKGVQCKKEVVL